MLSLLLFSKLLFINKFDVGFTIVVNALKGGRVLITKWERILLITIAVLFIGISIYECYKIYNIEKYIQETSSYFDGFIIPNIIYRSVDLDFTNQTGVARVKGGFTDLLLNSEGAVKKGEGYQVAIKTTNPSDLILSSSDLIFSWYHNGLAQATTVTNPNETLYPGASLVDTAFLSPVEGNDLKSIRVTVDFELMRSHFNTAR